MTSTGRALVRSPRSHCSPSRLLSTFRVGSAAWSNRRCRRRQRCTRGARPVVAHADVGYSQTGETLSLGCGHAHRDTVRLARDVATALVTGEERAVRAAVAGRTIRVEGAALNWRSVAARKTEGVVERPLAARLHGVDAGAAGAHGLRALAKSWVRRAAACLRWPGLGVGRTFGPRGTVG